MRARERWREREEGKGRKKEKGKKSRKNGKALSETNLGNVDRHDITVHREVDPRVLDSGHVGEDLELVGGLCVKGVKR